MMISCLRCDAEVEGEDEGSVPRGWCSVSSAKVSGPLCSMACLRELMAEMAQLIGLKVTLAELFNEGNTKPFFPKGEKG